MKLKKNMKKFIAILVFAIGLTTTSGAQSFLKDLQKQQSGEGKITVKQSTDIDNLVNNAQLKHDQEQTTKQQTTLPQQVQATKSKSAAHTPQNNATPTEQHHLDASKHKQSAEQKTQQPEQKQQATDRHIVKLTDQAAEPSSHTSNADTGKKMMRNSYKVTGYRIQAYSGGNTRADREKANRIGDEIKQKYPEQPVYVHFYSPRWICRVGNFRSYSEAAQILKGIKAMGYKQACIVKGKITVAY